MTGRAYAAGLALGLVVLALAGALTIPPLAARGDFAEQWAAARFTLEGGDPYDPAVWRDAAARLAGRASDARAFVYPPYVTLALTPLALLPLPAAATLWVGASVVLAIVALGRLLRAYRVTQPLVTFAFGLALLGSGPALLAIAQGQWAPLLVAAVAWAVADRPRGSAPYASLALLFKPQLAPLAIVALLRESPGRARTRVLIALGALLAVVAVSFAALAPLWISWYRGIGGFAATPPIRTTTLPTTLDALVGAAAPVLAAAVVLVAVAVCLTVPRGDAALALWLATAVLIAPYIQAYDHLLLLPPLVIATGIAGRRSQPMAAAIALAGCALLVAGGLLAAGTTMTRGGDVFGAIVPLGIWSLVALVAWGQRASDPV